MALSKKEPTTNDGLIFSSSAFSVMSEKKKQQREKNTMNHALINDV